MEIQRSDEGNLVPHSILLARYRIQGVLGVGERAVIYQARDLNFPDVKRIVAVKEVHYGHEHPDIRSANLKQAQREANILVALSHPSMPYLMDFFSQRDYTYMIMQNINGRDLDSILGKVKSLPLEKIIEWGIDVCDFLSYLHMYEPEPIVHRNIKPASIMIDHMGLIKMIGFGLAKGWQPNRKHTMVGTEGYTAPESYRGDTSPLSDIYSLGATLHHLITFTDPRQELPFSFAERPLAQYKPDAPKSLEDVVLKAVAYKQDNRFQSAAEMKDALNIVRAEMTRGSVPTPAPVEQPPVPTRHVFLSYSRTDLPMMQQIREDLHQRRINVWTDENLEPGTSSWQHAIENAIREAGALVVLLSPDARESKWVREEMNYAEMCGVKIFPALVRGPEIDAIPFGISLTQYVDLSDSVPDSYQQQLGSLAHSVTVHLLAQAD